MTADGEAPLFSGLLARRDTGACGGEMRASSADSSRAASRLVIGVLLGTLLLTFLGCSNPLAGSAGGGDPYFPKSGNGGYDVLHYDLDLTVNPVSGDVHGSAAIEARATQDLAAFNLDFAWLGEIALVTVDGISADWKRHDGELKVTCPSALSVQDEFSVLVTYSGEPEPVEDAGSFSLGWQHRGDLIFTLDEPEGASTWFPANDYPGDKATYTIRLTVPKPYVAAANGVLLSTEDRGTDQTFVWEMRHPQASYLASVTIADYVVETSEAPNGVVIRNYFDQSLADDAHEAFARTGEILAYFAEAFGPYPFEAYGVAVPATDTGGAMENQTLSLFGQDVLARRMTSDAATREIYLAHELAHQWFGDSVTIEQWRDIWLNEGFATYASWLWLEHDEGERALASVVEQSIQMLSDYPYPPLSDPGADGLFSANVYRRGALTLHALRLTVGDEVFLAILKEWASRYQYGSVTTADFMALVEEVAKDVPEEQLTELFKSWLDEEELPALPASGNGAPVAGAPTAGAPASAAGG
jgi:aminopeptidase N